MLKALRSCVSWLITCWVAASGEGIFETRAFALEACQAPAAERGSGARFSLASVESVGDDYLVRWVASGVTRVDVFVWDDEDGASGQAVGAGGNSGQLLVPRQSPGERTFFRLSPDCGEAIVIADRNLSRARLTNLRDVGGYRTMDGDWVRMGVAFRSNELSNLEAPDWQALAGLDIGAVVDLRHMDERNAAPGRVPNGARYVVADVFADPAQAMGNAQILIEAGQGGEVLIHLNRLMVSSPAALDAYAKLFRLLADESNGAILFHCTAGKDRTGWATAALLTLLGVPRETIYQDYLLSNSYRAEDITAGARKHGSVFVPLERVEPEYLAAAFDEVEQRYGTFDVYLRQGLGLDDHVIANLKSRFLQ